MILSKWQKNCLTEEGGLLMRKITVFAFVAIWLLVVQAVSVWPAWDPTQAQREKAMVEETIAQFKAADASMKVFFDKAYGYVVFPGIGKGGFIIGGGHGTGWVYEQGTFIGRATLTQLTVGAQIGGQSYREIIFFKDKQTLDSFKQGNVELAAQASAIIVKEGASKDASYSNGVAVFTMPTKGAMAEATVGGQKFKFTPK
jgi:lipid-binding SYLF domain-containing protein